jgi:hypothetical protein
MLLGATTQESIASQTRNKAELCKKILRRTSPSKTDVWSGGNQLV